MKSARILCLLSSLIVFSFSSSLFAQSLSLERVANGLSAPIFATYAPGDGRRLYVCQRGGTIRILNLDTGNLNPSNFISIPNVNTTGEGGLLGLAFHPDFENNNFFYVNYTLSVGGGFRTRISRFTATNSDSANTSTEQVVLEVSQPFSNHNAGWIGFSPTDGLLYVTMGDGGSGNDPGNRSQDITNQLLGKMLRLDVDGDDFPADGLRNYAIPNGNPFVGVTGDDEIYLYGLRNPFRCSFDRLTGDLYIGDVGQGAREEIDVIPSGYSGGMNLGWRLREGTIATPGVGGAQPADGVNPVYDYIRTGPFGGNSVTGGTVYRGPIKALQGNYFFADFGSNNFWSFKYDGSDPSTFNGNNIEDLIRWNGIFTTNVGALNSIVAFGEDLEGNIYICDLGGELYRITDGAITNPPVDGTIDIIAPVAGTVESGSVADVQASDDVSLVLRGVAAAPGTNSAQFLAFGTAPFVQVSSLIINYESRVATSNLSQTIELFNYSTNQFDVVDERDGSFADETITLEITDNVQSYVFVDGSVQARVSYRFDGPIFKFPWSTSIDLLGIQVVE